MSEIQVYLLGSYEPPYPRGLTTKSTGVRHNSAVDEREQIEHRQAIEELNAFILARHPQKQPVSLQLQFGKARQTRTLDPNDLTEWSE